MTEEQSADRLWVKVWNETAVVRVVGRGSFKLSGSLKEFGAAVVSAGARELVFDMSECIGMDSTFMGVVAGLALHLRKYEGRLTFIRLSEKARRLLGTIGLDHLVGVHLGDDVPARLASALSGSGPDRRFDAAADADASLSQTMLDAHETLVAINPSNLARFKDVLAFLREDARGRSTEGHE